jgi:hypothetical protein
MSDPAEKLGLDGLPDDEAADDLPDDVTSGNPGMAEFGGGSLEGIDAEMASVPADAEGFKPWTGAERPVGMPTEPDPGQRFLAALDEYAPASTASDALYAGAGGVLSGLGINPAQAAGAVGGDDREFAVRERLALANKRSPRAAPAAQLVGEIAPLAIATGGTSAAKQLAKPVLGGAIQGGLSALGNADTEDWGERLEALTGGAGAGALFGKIGQKVGQAGGWAGGKLADAWRDSGLMQRVAASGAYGSDIRKLAENIGGEEGLKKLGEWMQQRGIHQGEGWLGKLLPQTAETYGKNANAVNKAALGEQKAVLGELAQRTPVLVDTLPVTSKLRQGASELSDLAADEYEKQAGHAVDLAERIASKSRPGPGVSTMEFPEALKQRQSLDKLVNRRKLGGTLTDDLREENNRLAGDQFRGALRTSLDQQAPDIAPRFAAAQGDLSKGLDIERLANAREAKETGNQLMSLPTAILAGGGLAATAGGGVAGHALGGDTQSTSIGAAIPVAGAMATGALLKSRGHAATAGLANVGSKALRSAGNFVRDAATPAVVNAAIRAGQSGPTWVAPWREQPSDAPRIDDLAAPPPSPAAAVAGGRGHLLPQAAIQALNSNRAILGEYASQIAEAQGKEGANGPNAVANLIARLSQTDPKFKQTVLPELQRLTAGM